MRFVGGSRASLLVLGLTLAVLARSPRADAASFRVLDGAPAYVYSVSPDGSAAAGETGMDPEACLWNADGTAIGLGYLPGGYRSGARGVSNGASSATRRQTIFPVLASSRSSSRRSRSLIAVTTNTASPHTTGEACPFPGSGVFQRTFSLPLHFSGTPRSRLVPSFRGPRHPGQFSANAPEKPPESRISMRTARNQAPSNFVCFVIPLPLTFPPPNIATSFG